MITHMDHDSAVQGIQELKAFLKFLYTFNPKLERKIHQDPMLRFKLHALFSGLTPINKLCEGDWKTAEQLIVALQAFSTPNVFCIVIDTCKRANGRRFEFVNRWAVRNVASMHPDIFPDPDQVVDWLEQNPEALCHESITIGDYGHVVYGILSGFPRSACEGYLTYMEARQYLQENNVILIDRAKSYADIQRQYTSTLVLEALMDIPEHLDIMKSANLHGFGHFYCQVFSAQDYVYIDQLEKTFIELD